MSHSLEPAVLTIPEFIRWAKVGRTKTYELIAQGQLRTFRLGSRRLLTMQAAKAWLSSVQPSEGSDVAI